MLDLLLGQETLAAAQMTIGALLSLLGLGQQWGIGKRFREAFQPGGFRSAVQPDEPLNLGPLESMYSPEGLEALRTFENMPGGRLQIEGGKSAQEGWNRQGAMAQGGVDKITGLYEGGEGGEEVLDMLKRRAETPAVSSREVDLLVNQMRENFNQSLGAMSKQQTAEAGGRGYSADALNAIRQQLGGEASFRTEMGRMDTEFNRLQLNRQMEEQYQRNLLAGTGQYTSQLMPQWNIATAFQGDSGVQGQLANLASASELMGLQVPAEVQAQLANILTTGGMGIYGSGTQTFNAIQAAQAAQAAQPGMIPGLIGGVTGGVGSILGAVL